jgi:beta-lactamase regulating signal transducer with metallopeptidase domain
MQDFMFSLFTCSITMSALALFYMAIAPLLSKRYSAKGRYYTWLIVIIGLIIPFRPQFDNAVVKVDVPPEMTLPIIQIGNGTPVTEPNPTTVPPFFLASISIWQVLMIVWLAGVVVFIVHHAFKHYRFVKLVGRWSEDITDGTVLSTLENLKAEMGISKQIRLQMCASVGSPMMVGFINPKILLSRTDFAKDELRFILTHELVHYKRKDLWYKVLVLMATAIHWFNPIVYMAARAIDMQCELSCDDEVIRSTDADMRQHYSETIIGVAKYQSKVKTTLSTNFYGGKKGMKKRIFSIMDMGKKRAGVAVICAATLLTLGTGAALAVNAAESAPKTNVAIADGNQNTGSAKWEPLPEYEQFGISYNADSKMLFNGQLVRYFWDGYEVEPGISATRYDYFNEYGIVDAHTIRSVIELGGGGIDPFGELTDIAAYSRQEFDARDLSNYINPEPFIISASNGGEEAPGNSTATNMTELNATNGLISPNELAEMYAVYKPFGITYNEASNTLFYDGKAIRSFVDELAPNILRNANNPDGVIDVHVVRDFTIIDKDGYGEITGVKMDD